MRAGQSYRGARLQPPPHAARAAILLKTTLSDRLRQIEAF
ncbi:hypothetical protein ABENE_13985 [Asticcacaulis benevestitus DSM 16100 = ATCC BAA-896]|uniref:Uncharacterized protein n=1 Tax=Asticcacaulis benevestitus DSM 16100 = ATCC BAA-896 TaxID=1121022 RepID=V4PV81_9CAUL|nr:hypothetical protein ABENE_13985 [Asticcacaulis benevestitus DSM 16100 = ATCC BAA-896]